MGKISVFFEDKERYPFIIVDKPRGLASAPLKEGDDSALTQALDLFPEIRNVHGKKEVEYGLCHRIDTDTRGLILIALTQDFYDYIQRLQDEEKFIKIYKALCRFDPDCGSVENGYPFKPFYASVDDETFEASVSSYFRPYGPKRAMVRPVSEESGKYSLKKAGNVSYETKMSFKKIDGENYVAQCRITKGYRHQVRCHLSWCGFPIHGDKIYEPLYKEGDDFCFTAVGLEFTLPSGDLFSVRMEDCGF